MITVNITQNTLCYRDGHVIKDSEFLESLKDDICKQVKSHFLESLYPYPFEKSDCLHLENTYSLYLNNGRRISVNGHVYQLIKKESR